MTSPDKNIVKQLIDFGLTEKEAIVYLTAIESGTLTAQQLSRNSGINRSSTYMALESLVTNSLVGKSINDAGVGVYEAFGPDILLREAAEKERAQTKIRQEIDALVPRLASLSATLALHPRVKFYEGIGGIETANHDLFGLETEEMVRIFAVRPTISHKKNGQTIHIISPFGDTVLTTSDKLVSVCFIPTEKYNFSSDIRIYGNKIVLISEREKFATIIEDAYFAQVMKETFDLAWEEAKRLDAEIRSGDTQTKYRKIRAN